jgi:hypothetical protein
MSLPAWIKKQDTFTEVFATTLGSKEETSLADFQEVRDSIARCNSDGKCWIVTDPVTNKITRLAIKVDSKFKNKDLVQLAQYANVQWGLPRHIEDAAVLQIPWFKSFLLIDLVRLTLLQVECEKKIDISDAYANCEVDDDGWAIFEPRPKDTTAKVSIENCCLAPSASTCVSDYYSPFESDEGGNFPPNNDLLFTDSLSSQKKKNKRRYRFKRSL